MGLVLKLLPKNSTGQNWRSLNGRMRSEEEQIQHQTSQGLATVLNYLSGGPKKDMKATLSSFWGTKFALCATR